MKEYEITQTQHMKCNWKQREEKKMSEMKEHNKINTHIKSYRPLFEKDLKWITIRVNHNYEILCEELQMI